MPLPIRAHSCAAPTSPSSACRRPTSAWSNSPPTPRRPPSPNSSINSFRPEYGQRWGRHWLDVARYSDTTEKSVDGERRIPYAHTYRDYVIESFNRDRPFNQFVLEQIAADRLPAESKPDLRALGFLTVGRRFEGNIEAPELIIDDRIDTIGRGVLGLTLACARCHDHKFDAIPTADYYSLSGILASSTEPMDLPEIGTAPASDAVTKYRADRAALFADYEKHIDTTTTLARRLVRELAPEYLHYLVEESPNHRTVEGFIPLDTPRGLLVLGGAPAWAKVIDASVRRGEPYFALWPKLMSLPSSGFAENARAVLAEAGASPRATRPTRACRLRGQAATVHARGRRRLRCADHRGAHDALCAGSRRRDQRPHFAWHSPREAVAEDLQRFITEAQIVARRDIEAAGRIREKLTTLEATGPVERAQAVAVLSRARESKNPHPR